MADDESDEKSNSSGSEGSDAVNDETDRDAAASSSQVMAAGLRTPSATPAVRPTAAAGVPKTNSNGHTAAAAAAAGSVAGTAARAPAPKKTKSTTTKKRSDGKQMLINISNTRYAVGSGDFIFLFC